MVSAVCDLWSQISGDIRCQEIAPSTQTTISCNQVSLTQILYQIHINSFCAGNYSQMSRWIGAVYLQEVYRPWQPAGRLQ